MKDIKRVAVFSPNKKFFGHIILQLPFFHLLRRKYPNAHIRIYSPVSQISLITSLDLADEVVVYSKGLKEVKLLGALHKFSPDLIYNLRPYSLLLQLIIATLVRAKKVGFSSSFGSKLTYHVHVPYDISIYKAQLYHNLISPQDNEGFAYIRQLGGKHQEGISSNHICMMPGGGEGEHKRWGLENFIDLAKLYLKEDDTLKIAFILGPGEVEYEHQISSSLADDCVIYQSPTLHVISSLAQNSLVTIANDCGPSHIAQMCEGNYIGVWGWENQHPIKRISEWTWPGKKSIQIVAEYGKSIKSIPPSRVFGLSIGLLPKERT